MRVLLAIWLALYWSNALASAMTREHQRELRDEVATVCHLSRGKGLANPVAVSTWLRWVYEVCLSCGTSERSYMLT